MFHALHIMTLILCLLLGAIVPEELTLTTDVGLETPTKKPRLQPYLKIDSTISERVVWHEGNDDRGRLERPKERMGINSIPVRTAIRV